jgi:hypothetical protein
MADIGLNPPGTRHDRVVGGKATVTGIRFGHVLIKDTTTPNHRDVKLTTTPGAQPVAGICASQTDPTVGSAVGDDLEVVDAGIAEVWLAPSQTIVKGDQLVTSATSGAVKKRAAETPADIVGRAFQDATSGASPILISVELNAPFQTV